MRGYAALMIGLVLAVSADCQSASAQSQTVRQSGSVTNGHASSWTTNGVVQDAGNSTGSSYINTLGITANGGTPFCIQDTNTHTGPYRQFCLGISSSGMVMNVTPYNGAANLAFTVTINGVTYPFPFSAGGIVGPGTTTIGDLACWANGVGTLLNDCGISPYVLRTVASGATDTATSADRTVAWNSSTTSTKAETLYACTSPLNGRTITIKDEIGTAGTYPITITPSAGTIENASNYTMAFNSQAASFQCDGTTTNWVSL